MQRWLLVLLLTCSFVPACATPKPTPDGSAADSPAESANVDLPLEVPTETVALLQVQPSQLAKAWRAVPSVADLSGSEAPSSRALLTAILHQPFSWESIFVDTADSSSDAVPGLDRQRPIYAAVSTAGNEALLRHVRLGVPFYEADLLPLGFFVRLRLPAEDPESLKSWLQETCDEPNAACHRPRRITSEDSAVVIDYRVGGAPELVEQLTPSRAKASPKPADALTDDPSPALEAFATDDRALGFYLRSDKLTDALVLDRALLAGERLQSDSDRLQFPLYQKYMAELSQVYDLASPESREVSDSSTLLSVDKDDRLTLDVVRTLTAVGLETRRAGEQPTEIPKISDQPAALAATIAYDVGAALGASIPPKIVRFGPEHGTHEFEAMTDEIGWWTYLVALHNYPVGFGRGYAVFNLVENEEDGLLAQQIEYLKGFRVQFDAFEPSAAEGEQTRGGLVAIFDNRADIEPWADTIEEKAGELFGAPASTHIEKKDGLKQLHVLFGKNIQVGEPEGVEGALLRLDVARLGEQPTRGSDTDDEKASSVDGRDGLEISTQRSGTVSLLRANVGGRGGTLLSTLDSPPTRDNAQQPTGFSSCLHGAIAESRERLQMIDTREPFDVVGHFASFAEQLQARREECPEHARELGSMASRWYEWAGEIYADSGMLNKAGEVFEKSCKLDDQESCEPADNPPNFAEEVVLASNATNSDGFPPRPPWNPRVILKPDGFTLWSSRPLTRHLLNKRTPSGPPEWQNAEYRKKAGIFLGESELHGRHDIVVDRLSDAHTLAHLIGLPDVPKRQKNRRVLGKDGPPNIDFLLMTSRNKEGDFGQLFFHVPENIDEVYTRLEITQEGVSLTSRTDGETLQKVAPIDGCPKEGPTLCAADEPGPLLDRLPEADTAEQTEMLDKLAKRMRIDHIDPVLSDLPRGPALGIAIHVSEGIPFELVVRTVQQIEEVYTNPQITLIPRRKP